MILATLREGGPDGTLVVVDRARTRAVRAKEIAITLQAALDTWSTSAPQLRTLSEHLDRDVCTGAFALDLSRLAAPLPRGFAFYDAACYPEHISIIRKARGAALPVDFLEQPMMYQAVASPMLSWCDPIKVADDVGYGLDLEAEIVAITGEVPSGTKADEAAGHIKLLGLLNDVSLRNIVAPELARGFGFLHSKSDKSMGPFVVTPDELGSLWDGQMFTGGRYLIGIRGERLGELDPGKDVVFSYCDLIQHAAKTRILVPGTMIGAGTLANKGGEKGSGCIAEQRAREQLTQGGARTEYLRFGDELYLELFDLEGRSIFGPIRQKVAPLDKALRSR